MRSASKVLIVLILFYFILLIFKLIFIYRYNQQYVGVFGLPLIYPDSVSSWLGVFYSILILIGLFYYLFSEQYGFYVLYSVLLFYLIDLIYSIVFVDVYLIDTYFYVLFHISIVYFLLKKQFSNWRKLRLDKTILWITMLVIFVSILFNEGLLYWSN